MSLKAGIVGLPNVGKSTLFNAICKKNVLAANYPFATIEPNVGIVSVPDERMENLKKIYNPERFILTSYEFTDIAGLVEGASKGEGLGNKFLSHIREVDAVVHVVRCFEDKNILHTYNDVNPIRDIEIINLELIFSDLEIINNRLNKIGKKALMTKDKKELLEINTLDKAKKCLEENKFLNKFIFDEEENKILKSFNFITNKPTIYVCNVNEDDITKKGNKYTDMVKNYLTSENDDMIIISAKIESELSELLDDEKYQYLEELGIKESGLDKLIKKTYELLGLATYFTVGKDEVKAWTFKKGMKAPTCAGIIHTDFEKGFIKAEIMSYYDLQNMKDEKKVKEAGKVRLEGKEYEMQDGDICHFRFNV